MNHRERVRYQPPKPGKASDYISLVGTVAVTSVYIVCRVSTPYQRDNLPDQEAHLRDIAARCGLRVLGGLRAVANGNDLACLATVADKAKRAGAALLAETTCRFVRGPYFTPKVKSNFQVLPTENDLRRLRLITEGVTLLTAVDPDAPPSENKSCHCTRGQNGKGNQGGRPKKNEAGHKKHRRFEKQPLARAMREQGKSLTMIARELEVPKSTVQGWLQNLG